jgi:hypothetical protein
VAGKYDFGNNNRSWRLVIDTNKNVVFSVNPDGTGASGTNLTSNSTISLNTWVHLMGVYEGSFIRIYINGVQDNSTAYSSGLFNGSAHAAIGESFNAGVPGGNSFPGKLDDIKIYNYARSSAQVAWDYNRGGPVGLWKFDECTGSTAYDLSGQGNNGTITIGASGSQTTAGNCVTTDAAAAWYNGKDGKYNSSLGFDGTDDYVEVTDIAKLRFDESSKDFSLFAWTKRTTTGTEYILSKEDADNDGWRMQFNSSNQVLCSEDATDVTSTSTITDTNWHLIGCTIDRDGNGQIYIDGVANGSTVSMGTDAMATTSNIRIGTRSYTSTSYFNGLIDDVRVYNYVLTPTQIRTVYNENSAVRFGPLTGSP